MWTCYLCGKKKVIWQCDFDFEDYGYEGEGIVHTYECMNCGARIEIYEKIKGEDENDATDIRHTAEESGDYRAL